MHQFLYKQIDNTGLVLWRIAFGALITIEAFGAIATGWVRRVMVEPEFTFNFIGFEFLQPLPGNGMYFYFVLMGIFGLLVTLGYKYRAAMIGYAIMWTCVYLMQKTSYNNHYYLLMLLCWLMVFLPANARLSLDAKLKPKKRSIAVSRWVYAVVIFQIWIVYTYASIAKLYPAWLDGSVAALFMKGKSDYWLIGGFLQLPWVHFSIAYVGILFDLLIVPLMLWRKTRVVAFCVSIFFHLFNSVVFQIGIFPYMSIAFALFFFSSEILQKRFFRKPELYLGNEVVRPSYHRILVTLFSIYFIIQIGLPLRHWFYQDAVLWNEEGHRLSWRMMLRSRSGQLIFWTVDKKTGKRNNFPYRNYLSKKQYRGVRAKPDLIWQMAQRIKDIEAKNGRDVQVFASCSIKINGGVYHPFIDPDVDLSAVPWNHFKHHDWILPSPQSYFEKNN